jgi:hypothetical protein
MLAAAVVLIASTVHGQETMALSAETQVPLLLKILTYDRQLEAKAGTDLVIGIIHDPTDRSSAKAADEISSTLFKFAGKTVKKLPVKYFVIEYTRPADLEAFVKAKRVNMLYLTPGVSRSLPDILRVAHSLRLTTTTGVPDYVKRGVAVGLGERQSRPQILINLPSSKSEGSEFDASLLRIATVVQ